MMMKCNRCESSYHLTCLDKTKTQRISKTSIVCAKHCPEGRLNYEYLVKSFPSSCSGLYYLIGGSHDHVYMHVNILDPH